MARFTAELNIEIRWRLKYKTPGQRRAFWKRVCNWTEKTGRAVRCPIADESTIEAYALEFPEDCPPTALAEARRLGLAKAAAGLGLATWLHMAKG